MKKTKEEMAEKVEYQRKLKEILGECKDLAGMEESLREMKKNIIELLYSEELKEQLGFERSENREGGRENYRNGSYQKTVKSSSGPIELAVPRDRNGEFEPQVVKKYQTDILGIEDKVIALYGSGMTTRDISENISEIYGIGMSAETISNITNSVLMTVKEWQSRPLKAVYPVVFMDGMVFKVKKDGIVQRCTAYACIGIDLDGQKEVLGLHVGAAESAKYWLSVMNDLKGRGLQDVFIFCTDNLTGLDDAIKACFPNSDHQKCIVHQIRNSVKHVSYKDLKEVCADLKAVYSSPTADIGLENLEEFCKKWDKKYEYIGKSWLSNWEYLSAFWQYPTEIRQLIYTTNPIESFNRNMRKVTKNRAAFPSEDALVKCLFLGIRRLEKKWVAKTRNWGIIFSQLSILFNSRIAAK
jgi:transposase-like protein